MGAQHLVCVLPGHRSGNAKARVVEGATGSSEIWNGELDRIQQFPDHSGTLAGEMETAAAAQAAGQFGVPFHGVRVLSNNITTQEPNDTKSAEACQDFVAQGRDGRRRPHGETMTAAGGPLSAAHATR